MNHAPLTTFCAICNYVRQAVIGHNTATHLGQTAWMLTSMHNPKWSLKWCVHMCVPFVSTQTKLTHTQAPYAHSKSHINGGTRLNIAQNAACNICNETTANILHFQRTFIGWVKIKCRCSYIFVYVQVYNEHKEWKYHIINEVKEVLSSVMLRGKLIFILAMFSNGEMFFLTTKIIFMATLMEGLIYGVLNVYRFTKLHNLISFSSVSFMYFGLVSYSCMVKAKMKIVTKPQKHDLD